MGELKSGNFQKPEGTERLRESAEGGSVLGFRRAASESGRDSKPARQSRSEQLSSKKREQLKKIFPAMDIRKYAELKADLPEIRKRNASRDQEKRVIIPTRELQGEYRLEWANRPNEDISGWVNAYHDAEHHAPLYEVIAEEMERRLEETEKSG